MSKGHRRIAAHYAYLNRKLIRWGVVTLDGEGTVVDTGALENPDSQCGVEFHNGILIPGMVNAHTHLELSYLKGAIPAGCGFAGFAKEMRRSRRGMLTEEEREGIASFHDARMYAGGVSVAGDVANTGLALALKSKSRIRYRTFLELFGLSRKGLGDLPLLLEQHLRSGLAASITPHSVYSLNEKPFLLSIGYDPHSPLSIHFMESPDETELFRGGGAMKEWYDAEGLHDDFTGKYRSAADRLIENIPPSRKVLLVHNTMADEEDIRKITGHFGDNVTWVLCPRSNRHITGMKPPVDALRRCGARIALGTDSLASNASLSLIEEMKEFTDVPLEELIGWATIDGASALGADDMYGSFEAGKRPGAVLLSGIDWDVMSLTAASATKRII